MNARPLAGARTSLGPGGRPGGSSGGPPAGRTGRVRCGRCGDPFRPGAIRAEDAEGRPLCDGCNGLPPILDTSAPKETI